MQLPDGSASTAWCRMNDCYRTTQTDSEFCAKHGWNQNVEREPQTKHSTGEGTVAGNETPVSPRTAAGDATSRSAQLTDHLHQELRKELRKRLDATRVYTGRTGRPA